jgi:UDP-GlcNAc:undecaprenyl-phosphate GlcNAc-1-phosphate transferase
MTISQSDYVYLFIISYLLVSLITPVVRKIALTNGILDRPDSTHKSHKYPVPYLGGVAIIIGVITVTYTALLINEFLWSDFWLATSVLGPALLMGLVGLWDDLKSLNPLPRFIAQSIAAFVVAIILILNDNIGNPTGVTILDMAITILWIVGICNSINFFDNVDGGAAGAVAITSIALTVLAITADQFFIAALSIVMAGSTLGFLIWNRAPARIYMGDAGALFLGILIASLTVRFKPTTDYSLTSFLTPVFLLAIPILDTTVAVFSRFRRRVSPFQGGQDHLSHRLVRMGLSRKISVITLWSLSGLFGILAILISMPNIGNELNIAAVALGFWLLLFLYFFRTKDY